VRSERGGCRLVAPGLALAEKGAPGPDIAAFGHKDFAAGRGIALRGAGVELRAPRRRLQFHRAVGANLEPGRGTALSLALGFAYRAGGDQAVAVGRGDWERSHHLRAGASRSKGRQHRQLEGGELLRGGLPRRPW